MQMLKSKKSWKQEKKTTYHLQGHISKFNSWFIIWNSGRQHTQSAQRKTPPENNPVSKLSFKKWRKNKLKYSQTNNKINKIFTDRQKLNKCVETRHNSHKILKVLQAEITSGRNSNPQTKHTGKGNYGITKESKKYIFPLLSPHNRFWMQFLRHYVNNYIVGLTRYRYGM